MICIDYSKLGQIGLISLFFLLDLMTTYFFVISYRRMEPKDKKWYELELNIILRNTWKKWGVHKGTLIGAICVYPIIFAIGYFIENQFALGLIVGIYFMTFIVHIANFQALFKHKKKKKK